MIKANYVWKKPFLCTSIAKSQGRKILNFHIVQWSYLLNGIGQPAIKARFFGACHHASKKNNVGIKKIFP